MTNLSWDNYPNPTLFSKAGKYYVRVSIPTAIRHCFGTGSGNNNNRAKSTGTNDKSIAQRKMQDLAHKIYREFDEAQLEYADRNNKKTDEYAEGVIYGLADLFKYNKGMRPTLVPSTDYDELVKMKEAFDNYAIMVEDQKAVSADTDLSDDEMIGYLEQVDADVDGMIERLMSGEEIDLEDETLRTSNKVQKALFPEVAFNAKITKYLQHHSEPIVQSYWQDLLTFASQEQGKKAPVFKKFADVKDYVIYDERVETMGLPLVTQKPDDGSFADRMGDYKPISRPRRNVPKSTQYISDVTEEYFAQVENHPKIRPETKYKRKRGVNIFIKLVGDLPLQEISRSTPRRFAQALTKDNPEIAHKTLANFFSAMNQFVKYLYGWEYIETNPFQNFDTHDYGKPSEKWLALSEEELFLVFNHDWEDQEYLLLSLLITTGMRLNEACTLTWERFNDTKYQGYRFFSTEDTDIEEVQVKNKGSKRLIPIHNDIVLPPKGTGRLFNYNVRDKSASSSANAVLRPIFNQICPHPRKVAHSLRSNFKTLCTEASIPKDVHDYLTGHGSGDVGQDIYGGAGLIFKADQINKIRHPWLNRKSK